MTAAPDNTATPELDPTRVRFLSPDTCHIHLGTHDALHVTVENDRIYGGVYAAYAFPVAYPEGYISLIHVGDEEEMEIGVIRDLAEFPEAAARLVHEALARRYFVHTIMRIRHMGWKYGFVAMDVETDKGSASFLMPWRHDRATDYGRHGKILIDVDNNRYLVPDLRKLAARELSEFQRYIYW